MSNRDRGLKKWHGFFMPEHSGELKNIWHEDKKIKMPVLDEYQLQEFEESINFAVEYHKPVEFKLYNDGFEEKIVGCVQYVDPIKRQFNVKELDNHVRYIRFSEIMDVKII